MAAINDYNISTSTFGRFMIGRSAIQIAQKGSQVTGQNIANVNTDGYSRQMMNQYALRHPAVAGVDTPPGYGVDISAINRVRSEFYDNQIRYALASRNYWMQLGETLTTIEVVFLEPGETGINTYLSTFFESWQEVSVNPESYAARVNLVEQTETLTGVVRNMYRRMEELSVELEKSIDDMINEVNVLAREIAELNKEIVFFQALGKVSNETLDERDLKMEQLSKLVDTNVWYKTNGAVEIVVGGRTLLHDDIYFAIQKEVDDVPETGERAISLYNTFGFDFNLKGGELLGLIESFNETVPYYKAALNDIVYNLIWEVNQLHREGVGLDGATALNFFDWDGPMLGEIVINDLLLGSDDETNITGVSFLTNSPESKKLFNGDYTISTAINNGDPVEAILASVYSAKGGDLVTPGSVTVNPATEDINSSILFEVTKVDGDEIYVNYTYIHTVTNASGELQTITGEGIKKLIAGANNADLFFGDDPAQQLLLDMDLEDRANFTVGDKFVVQVTAAGDGTSDQISLQNAGGDVQYAVTAAAGAFEGEQRYDFFQVDETTGESRLVSIFINTDIGGLIDEDPAAEFTVGEYAPVYPIAEIYRAAAKFFVNPELLENPESIAAAASPGAPGDGENALIIARLREAAIDALGGVTFEEFFRSLMVDLGVMGREAQHMEYNMNVVYQNLAEVNESIYGVSLDDEMLNLVMYQHAYNAAAEYLSIVDQMLDKLINGII